MVTQGSKNKHSPKMATGSEKGAKLAICKNLNFTKQLVPNPFEKPFMLLTRIMMKRLPSHAIWTQ